MHVLTDGLALGERRNHGLAEVLRVGAREADAVDAGHGVAGAQKLAKVGAQVRCEIAAPGVHVLPEQGDLANALGGQLRHLGDHLARAAADLAAADTRDDAVGALGVAAHRDLHPCLEAALAVHRERSGEAPLRTDAERTARNALAAGPEPLAQMRDRARPERDIDERVEVEEPLALRLGVAAADRDHGVAAARLQRARLREVGREALIGLLADRAGVEHEHVGLVLRDRLAEPELLEHALDALAVVSVHLAAECGQVVALHGPEMVPPPPTAV